MLFLFEVIIVCYILISLCFLIGIKLLIEKCREALAIFF